MTHVLVVEDSPTQAVELQILLESAGFQVEVARNGAVGLDRCRTHAIDVVLSDVVMPGMSGYELCKHLKNDAATVHIPVVLLTSLSDPMDIIRGLECGADNFLTKPYDGASLVGRVRRLLDNRAARGDRKVSVGVEVILMGKQFTINSEKEQMLDLLLSTFEEVLRSRQREFEAKLNEEASRESHRFLQSALDALTKQVVIVSDSGEIVAVNASLRRFASENAWANADALEGADYLDSWSHGLGAREHQSQVVAGMQAVKSGEVATFDYDYFAQVGIRTRYFSVSIARFEDRGRALLAVEHEDITGRKQLERQFYHSQKMEAIGQLAGGVAHDFNNLLTVIRSYSDLLRMDFPVGDPKREDLEEILRATDAAGALTKQLLAFGRQQMLKLEVLDVNTVISELEKMLRRLIGEDIEYASVLEQDAPRIEADPGQIQQILMNLVINARDAMPTGGKVTIETRSVDIDESYAITHNQLAVGNYVLIEVTDTGTGMSQELQARIFEPFFTTKEIGKGTGLGLSTVYGIVQQCHGYIGVYSEVERGTTFKIYLPSVDGAPVSSLSASEVMRSEGNETVLLVEDNVAVRGVLQRVLTEAGYRVLAASGASDARAFCDSPSEVIQLLLTDVVMPGLSGPDLAAELLAKRPEMKVLFMSGYSGTAITRHGMLREGLVFLQKPFSPASVTRAVRAALNA